jgi:hypothetical protein
METWKDSVDVSLKSETVCFSEMLVSSYKYTQCYNPETNINNVKTSNLMESLCFSVVGMMMVMRMIMVLLLMMTMMMMRRRFALWLSVIVIPSFYIYSYGDTKIIFTLQY